MQRFPLIAAFFVLVGLFPATAVDPVLHSPDVVEPGDVVQVFVTGEPLENMVVVLRDSSGLAICRAEGFVWRTPTGRSASVALLGIPSTAVPGRHILAVDADEGRAEWHLEKPLFLEAAVFPEEIVVLNDSMNTLLSDDSERKKNEARELWAVLTSFDPSAIHNPGRLLAPLEVLEPTAGYGDRRRYRMPDGSESMSVHFGRDFRAVRGTPVRSSGSGRVALAVDRLLTGNTVVIEHLPGVFTMYYHLDSITVTQGDMVAGGAPIGTVGSTGFSTGNHLHWELRVGTTPVKPDPFLDQPLLDTNRMMGKM